jgi:hypothetical protein
MIRRLAIEKLSHVDDEPDLVVQRIASDGRRVSEDTNRRMIRHALTT